jgi:hypothetical protein
MDWDAFVGRNKYGIYAGLMIASAIVMIASQKPAASMNTVKPADGYYRDCAAARAADVTPILRGERGYRPELDGDHDGVACEPWTTAENR